MAVLTSNTVHDNVTAAGAHAIMQHIHTVLTGIGLSKANWTGTYDGSGSGSSSQAPTVAGTTSAWQAFNFTDTHQTLHPVTVWFRLSFGAYSSSSYPSYVVHMRVSEGVDGSGNALGRVVDVVPAQYAYSSGTTFQWAAGATTGNFARYSGDCLTLLVSTSSLTSGAAPGIRRSLVELHIERRYKVSAVSPDGGFVGLIHNNHIGGGQYGSKSGEVTGITSLTPASTDVSDVWANRAGGAKLDYISSAPVVAPVYYNDIAQSPTTYRKMFTIPQATVTHSAIIALDFSGSEKKYLVHKPDHTPLYDSYALLFEWE